MVTVAVDMVWRVSLTLSLQCTVEPSMDVFESRADGEIRYRHIGEGVSQQENYRKWLWLSQTGRQSSKHPQ
jgi:hypothetical protein